MCAALAVVTGPEIPLSNNPRDFSADLFKSGISLNVELMNIFKDLHTNHYLAYFHILDWPWSRQIGKESYNNFILIQRML